MGQHAYPARYFDGQTAGATPVRVVLDDSVGVVRILSGAGVELASWPQKDLRKVKDPGYKDGVIFQRFGNDDARLILQYAEDAEALVAAVPSATRVDVPAGTFRRVVLLTGAAIAAVCLTLFVILPNLADTMATLISPEREEEIGETVVSQMQFALDARTFCETPEGRAALDKMTARLAADLDLPYELKVNVLRHPMVNAFAAPGGHVIFMQGLIEKADTPEEVAGVLAHEIGHVYARDPLRVAMRAAGSAGIISMVVGDFAGAALVVLMTEQIMRASYTREAEAAADNFAHELLAAAALPTEGLAAFFEKLEAEHGDVEGVAELLATHPNLASRTQAARDAETRGGDFDFRPVLNDQEWAALRAICG